MKKLFVFAAAILALASCSQGDEPQAIVETREISFAPAATETRAKTVDETTTANLGNFAVWGYVKANDNFNSAVFSNTLVKKTATNKSDFSTVEVDVWQPEGGDVKYWSPGGEYWFSALYPQFAENGPIYSFSTTGTAHTQSISNFSIVDNGVATKDVVVARPIKATVEANSQSRVAVGLTFDHMLSRVRFSFENTFADDNVTIKISNVQLNNVIATADANIVTTTERGDTLVANWTSKVKDLIVNFQDASEVSDAVGQNGKFTTEYRLFIPDKDIVQKGAYTLTFTLDVYADNVLVLTKTYTVDNPAEHCEAVGLKEFKYENGRSYLFNAKINGNLLKEEIYPIQFDVKVTPWATDYTIDDDIFAE